MRPKYNIGTLVKLLDLSDTVTDGAHFFAVVAGYSIDAAGLKYFTMRDDVRVIFDDSEVVQAYRLMPKKKRKAKAVKTEV